MRELDDRHYIRHKLFEDEGSSSLKYRRLVIGGGSWWEFVKYELLTTFLGPIPGALGLALRKRLYPLLFEEIGADVVFGRNLVLRCPRRIRLGDGVMIDDGCVIDARGGEGVSIGDRVILNRETFVQAKVGPIHIGEEADIGAGSGLYSQGGIQIGDQVAMGGRCIVGGGLIDPSLEHPESGDPPGTRDQRKVSKGPIRIEDRVAMGVAVVVLDGVEIGTGCIVGAASVLRESVPPYSIVVPHQRLILLPRSGQAPEGATPATSRSGRAEEDPPTTGEETPQAPSMPPAASGEPDPRTVRAVFGAIDEINLQLPPGGRLAKAMDASLFGNGGPLDSLRLVNLLVATEERMAEEFERRVDLTDEAIVAEGGRNPLQTVRSFVEYVEGRRRSG
ncbi:MAG: DapH/DapD/GlmU-related protein [Gemmatimonadota bacterium]